MRIRLQHLTKRYDQSLAIDRLDLEVEPGEFLVVLGPSGSGKTTALRLIAGLEEPDEGEIWMGERNVTRLPPRARDVAMVFQSYALYPHLTVAENIAFPLRVRKLGEAEARRRVQEAAAKLGLEGKLERRPRALSGGERQRVALARAIVRQPNAFLMDEPLSNLDAQLRLETRAELKRLQHELRATTVYVTHDQAEAMTLAHRVAVMAAGRLQQVDTPANVYNHPANRFVAGFVGSPPMNLLDGRADSQARGIALNGAVWPLRDEAARASDPTAPRAGAAGTPWDRLGRRERVVLGIRPEHVQVSSHERLGAVPGRVYVSEPAGNENVVVVRLGEQMLTARVPAEVELDYDQPVWVSAAAERMHFFEPDTGKAI